MITASRLPSPRGAAIVLAVAAVGGAGVVAARRAAKVAPIAVDPSEIAFDPFATPAPPPPPARHDCTLEGISQGLHVWLHLHSRLPNRDRRPGHWTFEITAGAMTRAVTFRLDRDRRGDVSGRCLDCDVDAPFLVGVELAPSGYAFAIYIVGQDRLPLAAPTIDLTVRHGRPSARYSIAPSYLRREPNGLGCGVYHVASKSLHFELEP